MVPTFCTCSQKFLSKVDYFMSSGNKWHSRTKFLIKTLFLNIPQRHTIVYYCKSELMMLMHHHKSCLFFKAKQWATRLNQVYDLGIESIQYAHHHRPWSQAAGTQIPWVIRPFASQLLHRTCQEAQYPFLRTAIAVHTSPGSSLVLMQAEQSY